MSRSPKCVYSEQIGMDLRQHWRILISDVRYGSRALAAAPGFTGIAVLVIALGIGATVSIFSVVNAVLLRSLPYGHPEKLVYLWSPNSNFKGVPQEIGPNVPDFYEWQRLSHNFSAMTMLRSVAVNLVRGGSATRAEAAFVTGNFFRTLEARPQFGRSLDANDDTRGHEHVAVISDALRRSQFGSSRNVLGRQIQLRSPEIHGRRSNAERLRISVRRRHPVRIIPDSSKRISGCLWRLPPPKKQIGRTLRVLMHR